jgi:hypothetical protein
MTIQALHLVFVSLLLAGAARLAEASLLPLGRAVRGVWVAALLGALLLPAALRWAPDLRSGPVSEPSAAGAGVIAELLERAVPVSEGSRWFDRLRPGTGLDSAVGAAWLTSSAAAGLVLVLLLGRLAVAGQRWPRQRIEEVEVFVSPDEGPAVYGLVRARIVVPVWLFGCSPAERRLILLHEREHAESGDHRLLVLGFALFAAAPWNPVFWWMLLRLRLAVEVDCDRRVLRRSGDVRTYGSMLLGIAGRSRSPLASAALVEPASFLQRRILAMTTRRPRLAALRSALLAICALGLVALACETAPPTELALPAEPTPAEATLAVPEERPVILKRVPIDPSLVGATVTETEHEIAGDDAARIRTAPPPSLPEVESPETGPLEGVKVRVKAMEMAAPSAEGRGTPLIYVDGVRVSEVDMHALDPDRIERIEVLKGGAAERLFGRTAQYGVIQIVTKAAGAPQR